jgi:hypothetical protein
MTYLNSLLRWWQDVFATTANTLTYLSILIPGIWAILSVRASPDRLSIWSKRIFIFLFIIGIVILPVVSIFYPKRSTTLSKLEKCCANARAQTMKSFYNLQHCKDLPKPSDTPVVIKCLVKPLSPNSGDTVIEMYMQFPLDHPMFKKPTARLALFDHTHDKSTSIRFTRELAINFLEALRSENANYSASIINVLGNTQEFSHSTSAASTASDSTMHKTVNYLNCDNNMETMLMDKKSIITPKVHVLLQGHEVLASLMQHFNSYRLCLVCPDFRDKQQQPNVYMPLVVTVQLKNLIFK